MNQDTISGKWKEIKGEIQKTWGSITGDEIEKTKGDMKAVAGLLQQKYGMAREEADEKVTSLYSKFDEAKHKIAEGVAEKTEDVKNSLRNDVDKDIQKH